MLSKEKVKHLKSLHLAKFRNESGMFIAEGPKLVAELSGSNFQTLSIYHTPEWNPELAIGLTGDVVLISERELQQISMLKTPNSVFAVVKIPNESLDHSVVMNGLSLLLDDIHDPGNLGTIIRIADWFGVHQIICSPDCVEVYNPKVVQSSMGSVFRVRVCYQEPTAFLQQYSEKLPVYGAYLEGESVFTAPLDRKGIIVIGSESHGIRKEIAPYITQRIWIPPFGAEGSAHAESLNASVACGIVLYEFRKREFFEQ